MIFSFRWTSRKQRGVNYCGQKKKTIEISLNGLLKLYQLHTCVEETGGEAREPAAEILRDSLEGEEHLVWAFDFLFGLQEFFAPRFSHALGTLVNRVAN